MLRVIREFSIAVGVVVVLSHIFEFLALLLVAMFNADWIKLIELNIQERISAQHYSVVFFLEKVVLVPFLETLVFQYALIRLLRYFSFNVVFILLVSSIAFGLNHFYSIGYAFTLFLIGLVYSGSYLYLEKHRSVGFAFLAVALAHSIDNMIAIYF